MIRGSSKLLFWVQNNLTFKLYRGLGQCGTPGQAPSARFFKLSKILNKLVLLVVLSLTGVATRDSSCGAAATECHMGMWDV